MISLKESRLRELERVRAELARFTYRPGWELSVEPIESLFAASVGYLIVRYETPDTYNPDILTLHQQVRLLLPPPELIIDNGSDMFARWLQDALFEIERHESREWLRRDGEIFDDPHREDLRP